MMAGQYVTHEGQVCQVIKISSLAIGHNPNAERHDVFSLVPVGGGPLIRVVNPAAADLPLTQGCESCGKAPGFGFCVESRQGVPT